LVVGAVAAGVIGEISFDMSWEKGRNMWRPPQRWSEIYVPSLAPGAKHTKSYNPEDTVLFAR
jgi:hypothetical protein